MAPKQKWLYLHVVCENDLSNIGEMTVSLPFNGKDTVDDILDALGRQPNIPAAIAEARRGRRLQLSLSEAEDHRSINSDDVVAAYPQYGDLFVHCHPPPNVVVHCNSSALQCGKVTSKYRITPTTTADTVWRLFCADNHVDPEQLRQCACLSRSAEEGGVPMSWTECIRVGADKVSELYVVQNGSCSPAQALQKAETYAASGRYREVLVIYNTIEDQLPNDEMKSIMWTKKAAVYMETRRWPKAAHELTKYLAVHPDDIVHLVSLGKALHEMQDYSGAISAFKAALERVESGHVQAIDAVTREIRIRLGAALYCHGEILVGSELVQQQLLDESVPKIDIGLYWMVHFYLCKKCYRDALRWSIDVFIRNQKDPMYRSLFATALTAAPDGVQIIKDDILKGAGKDAASGFAFLATSARDCGALVQAKELNRRALELDPTNANIALNLIHLIENCVSYKEAIQLAHDWMMENANLAVGSVTAERFAKVIEPCLQEFTDVLSASPREVVALVSRPRRCVRGGEEAVNLYDSPSECAAIAPLVEVGWENQPGSRCTYSEQQQNLLAIFFTTTKLLFISGHLTCISQLLHMVNPLRYKQNLHTTLIRNEQAYFTSVMMLMQHLDPPARPPEDVSDIVYVVGDSHSLSPSWHNVSLCGGTRRAVFVNCLVTGVKIWHLRDESTFYPKRQFECMMEHIPDGAPFVLFIIGEIDCREGILQAVEKGYYDTADEAMDRVVSIYTKKLLEVKRQKRFGTVFVHYPLPILDITRQIVLNFHQALSRGLDAPDVRGQLVGMNVPVLDETNKIKAAFQFDGTHISPTYLAAVEQQLQNYTPKE